MQCARCQVPCCLEEIEKRGQFREQKNLGPLEKLLKMAYFVFCPHNKITSRTFRISGTGTLIVTFEILSLS
jgi:hypothetical protein